MVINWIFTGKYSWLDNFYYHPFVLDEVIYPTVEHAYQQAKTHDPEWRDIIYRAATPNEAKALGQMCPMRPDWDDVKVDIMRRCIAIKFEDPDLRAKLLATGNETIIEGNTWGDTFWGQVDGIGSNWLGRILMDERSIIRHIQEMNTCDPQFQPEHL